MEITEVNKLIDDIEKKITIIKDMINDHDACNSDMSKQVLKAAISKYASSLESTNRGAQS